MPIAPRNLLLRSASLERLPWLSHGFSVRRGGVSRCYGAESLNLGYTQADLRQAVEKNRLRFLRALGAMDGRKPWPLITLKQVHSDIIHVVKSRNPGPLIGDGLVTQIPGLVLAVQTADCLPVLLVDRKNRAVGAFHAGWRGTLRRIAEKGLGIMRHEYGTEPQHVLAAIGPGIQKCCYQIGPEVQSEFDSQFEYSHELFHETYCPDPIREKYPLLFLNARAPGHGEAATKISLDLGEANRRQLILAGVPEDQIAVRKECTSCKPTKFFSHRAEKGKTGRMMAGIAISR